MDSEKIKLAIAPIAWSNDDRPELGAGNTFEQSISEMALAGFRGTERGSKFPSDPLMLKEALDMRGLSLCNSWFSSFLISKPFEATAAAFERAIAFLKAAGARTVGVSEQSYSLQGLDVPIFKGRYIMNEKEWDLLCDGLNKLGRMAAREGMSLTFHHHMGTTVQSAEEVSKLMSRTDPETVGLLYDSGHFAYCGEDPLQSLKDFADRVRHVHLKDIRPAVADMVRDEDMSFMDGVVAGTFTVPGDGALDFLPIFEVLESRGYRGWLVVEAEQDPAVANPFAYALRAREYLREITGI
ncbi:MAG: myo-inosose-2 dehydratase [Clostridiales Family XIII bacterium]|jgi:inosose dehydratase|nr:myo-inosose-2 dehydratase [Clostridiales Family XIII bacterium]